MVTIVTRAGKGTPLTNDEVDANFVNLNNGLAAGGSGTVTSVSGTGTVNGITLTGTVTASGNITLGGALSGIGNSQLTNSSLTLGSTSVSLGGTASIISGITLAGASIDNSAPYLTYVGTSAPTYTVGRTFYDSTYDSLAYYSGVTGNEVLLGQQTQLLVRNETGSTIPKGSVCYISGRSGSTPLIQLARADSSTTATAVGFTNLAMANNTNGYLVILGSLYDVNTSGFSPGSTLYLSAVTAGAYTDVKPSAPNLAIRVGFSLYNNLTAGSLFASFRPVSTSAADITGTLPIGSGGTNATTAAGARTNLGLGTIATQDAATVAITGGTVSGTRVNPRIGTTTGAASPITPTSDTADQYNVTALAVAATIAIPTGTPVDGQKLTLRIKDNGTARALTWTTSAGGYRILGTTLPTTTVLSKTVYVGCVYNAADAFWDVVAVAQQA
jgi:hypothetical protein